MGSDFEKIRRDLIKSGDLFEDPDFPCIHSSVFHTESSSSPPFTFVWMRPHEICDDPKFLGEISLSPDQQQQRLQTSKAMMIQSNNNHNDSRSKRVNFESILGKLGDPWFISSISTIFQTEGLFYRVVPADQSFDVEDYAGIFRFRIWWFGQWQEVMIDDRLPIIVSPNIQTNMHHSSSSSSSYRSSHHHHKLAFIQPLNGNIFWAALLEKAFAKLHGSYEALKYGTSIECLSDLTGGVTEMIDLKYKQKQIHHNNNNSLKNRDLHFDDDNNYDDHLNHMLEMRLLIQRLLSITSIVTAVINVNPDDHDNDDNEDEVNFANPKNFSPPHQYHDHRKGSFVFGENLNQHHHHNHRHHPHHRYQHQNPKINGHKSSSSLSSSSSDHHSPLQSLAYDVDAALHSPSGGSAGSSRSRTSPSTAAGQRRSKSYAFPRLSCGIVANTNYRITAIERIETLIGENREQIFLIKLVNCIGIPVSYTGPYGDKKDHSWSRIIESDRIRIYAMDQDDDDDDEDEKDIISAGDDSLLHIADHHLLRSSDIHAITNSKKHIFSSKPLKQNQHSKHNNKSSSSSPQSSTSSSSSHLLKRKANRKQRSSSSFWIEFSDFMRIFSHLEVVYLDAETSRDEPSLRCGSRFPLLVKLYHGFWRKGITAGGCRNNVETFHQNPQIELTLAAESDDMVIICLNQHSVLEPQVVGFSIYKSPSVTATAATTATSTALVSSATSSSNSSLSSSSSPLSSSIEHHNRHQLMMSNKQQTQQQNRLDRQFFKRNKSLINSSYSNSRQVLLRCCLDRGSYVLMPTSFEAGFENSFTIRVYSMKGIKLRLLDHINCVNKSTLDMISRSKSSSTTTAAATADLKFHAEYEIVFMQIADEHKNISSHDLQELLESTLPNDYVKSCATTDVCRLMISALESSSSSTSNSSHHHPGRMSFKDYKIMMCNLKYWQNVFKNHTKGTTTGVLRIERLEDSLREMGFQLSTDVMSSLVLKFGRKDSTIRFGDFVSIILHLIISFNIFSRMQSKQEHQRKHQLKHQQLQQGNHVKQQQQPHLHHHPLHHHSNVILDPFTSDSFNLYSNPNPSSNISICLSDWLKISLQT